MGEMESSNWALQKKISHALGETLEEWDIPNTFPRIGPKMQKTTT